VAREDFNRGDFVSFDGGSGWSQGVYKFCGWRNNLPDAPAMLETGDGPCCCAIEKRESEIYIVSRAIDRFDPAI